VRSSSGSNIKVSNLAQMLPAARHELLLVNDSDIRVPSDYLRKAIGAARRHFGGTSDLPLSRRCRPDRRSFDSGLAPRSVGHCNRFCAWRSERPGFLEKGLRFGLGSTLAFAGVTLEAIGGFEVLLRLSGRRL